MVGEAADDHLDPDRGEDQPHDLDRDAHPDLAEDALDLIEAAAEAGVKIPDDLRVIGFDDTRLAALARPMLSSVRIPLAELGSAAIDMLLSRISKVDRPPQRLCLRTSLVVRESSRAGS